MDGFGSLLGEPGSSTHPFPFSWAGICGSSSNRNVPCMGPFPGMGSEDELEGTCGFPLMNGVRLAN